MDQLSELDGQKLSVKNNETGEMITLRSGLCAPHHATTIMIVLCVLYKLDLSWQKATSAIAHKEVEGRGNRTRIMLGAKDVILINDSYNAGPASMAAALSHMADLPPCNKGLILTDMLELGAQTDEAHDALIPLITDIAPHQLALVGEAMGRIAPAITAAAHMHHYPDPSACAEALMTQFATCDVILIKGSNGSGAPALAQALLSSNNSHLKCLRGLFMFPDLLVPLAEHFQPLNLFRYLTFRTGGAVMTALLLSLCCGPAFIVWLKSHQAEGQPIRQDGPESHILTKAGTPTMGGLLILGVFVITTLLWVPLGNAYLWPILIVAIGFGGIGAIDDWLKLKNRSSAGLRSSQKFLLQSALALVAIIYLVELSPADLRYGIALPFPKRYAVIFILFLYPFALVVIVGASNAVNLTDGLDGLTIVPVMIAAAVFALIAYLSGNLNFADYLQIHYIPGTGELAVVCGALIGAGLWVFMVECPRLPKSLWVIQALLPLAGRWVPFLLQHAMNWFWPSQVAYSCLRPFQSSYKSPPSN